MKEHETKKSRHQQHHEQRKQVHARMMADMTKKNEEIARKNEEYKRVSRNCINKAKTSDPPINPVLPERDDPLLRQDKYL